MYKNGAHISMILPRWQVFLGVILHVGVLEGLLKSKCYPVKLAPSLLVTVMNLKLLAANLLGDLWYWFRVIFWLTDKQTNETDCVHCAMNNQWTTSPLKTGLDVMHCHPLCRTHFNQYQAWSVALGWPGDGDCYLMHRMQSDGMNTLGEAVPCLWS